MSKSRQRAKQRQQERRAARLGASQADKKRSVETDDGERTSAYVEEDLERQAELAVGAPPEELGRSDETLEHEPEPPDFGPDEEQAEREEHHRERRHEEHHERGKVLQFLSNVWAELQRVQWPNRQQLISLTGVVLGFVLIAGGYLGLLDAIFSRLIDRII